MPPQFLISNEYCLLIVWFDIYKTDTQNNQSINKQNDLSQGQWIKNNGKKQQNIK